MARGTNKVEILGQHITGQQGLWDFIYVASATKNPLYNIGDRVVLPDSRVFRYSKAGAAITNAYLDYALYFAAGPRNKWYENPTAGQSSGDREISLPFDEAGTVTPAASTTVTIDELRGGYVVIYKAGVANQCIRGIVGNTASLAASPYTVTLYLDAPLPYDVVVADGIEIISNPWSDVRPAMASASATHTMCGYGVVTCSSSDYIWVQTWGIMRISQAAAPTDYERSYYFSTNGNCSHRSDVGTGVNDQRAGTLIIPGTDQSAFIMLQISP